MLELWVIGGENPRKDLAVALLCYSTATEPRDDEIRIDSTLEGWVEALIMQNRSPDFGEITVL